VGAINFQNFSSKALGIARTPAENSGGRASVVAAQHLLWQPRKLKEIHVPRHQELWRPAQFTSEACRVRQVENHQSINKLRLEHCQRPRQRATPIVCDQERFLCTSGLDQSSNIFHQRAGFVSRNLLWRISIAVAAQVRRPYAITHLCQQRHLVSTGVSMFRKAVQAERQAVARSHSGNLKVDAVGGNADKLWVPAHWSYAELRAAFIVSLLPGFPARTLVCESTSRKTPSMAFTSRLTAAAASG